MAHNNDAVLIVGAGPRLGAAIARSLGSGGRPIGLVGRSPDGVNSVREMLRSEGMTVSGAAADVADQAALSGAIEQLASELGEFDVAVHNVSAWRDAGAETLTATDLLADVAIGTASLATIASTVVPAMRRRGHGTLLATGSGAADDPTPGAPSLAVQKAGLRVLIDGFAQELTPAGVHCAMILIRGGLGTPGFDVADIAPLYADLVDESDKPPETWRTVVEFTGSGGHTSA